MCLVQKKATRKISWSLKENACFVKEKQWKAKSKQGTKMWKNFHYSSASFI